MICKGCDSVFDGEALSRVLAKEPLHARQVSDDRHPEGYNVVNRGMDVQSLPF